MVHDRNLGICSSVGAKCCLTGTPPLSLTWCAVQPSRPLATGNKVRQKQQNLLVLSLGWCVVRLDDQVGREPAPRFVAEPLHLVKQLTPERYTTVAMPNVPACISEC